MRLSKYVGFDRGVFLIGHEFGPRLLAVNAELADAIDEYDERFGERVDLSDSALADYDGATTDARIESAMDCGDIRVNHCGTMVWVSHYEWCREFASESDALKFCHEFAPTSPLEVIEE
jgi:hypothetical protein